MDIDNHISGKTCVLAVIGNPIEHSISPQLHNTISKYLGMDAIYVPFKVDKNRFPEAAAGLRALNIKGFNITIPYKEAIIKHLDEVSDEALMMGTVNTVKNANGILTGYNTDAAAFSKSFKDETNSDFVNRKVVIAGAGGTTRAIACKIAMEGAKEINIINRTLSKAETICSMINSNFNNISKCFITEAPEAAEAFTAADIIINTTPAGMHPNINERPFAGFPEFNSAQTVYDVIYNPRKTRFLQDAERCGCKTANGLGMLFYQGIYAYEIWFDIKLPEDFVKEYFELFKKS